MTETESLLSPQEVAAELTVAWLSNPNTRASAEDALAFFQTMQGAVATADPVAVEPEKAKAYEPAVSVRRSLASREHIISLIDGKPYRTLRRHLTGNGLTPEQYRERYNLRPDYPMVSPAYSEARRDMAKKIGLGRKSGAKPAAKSK